MSNTLLEIHNRLKEDATLRVEWVGEGKGEFLFVRSPNRAVEVSIADEGVFVEYWNDTDELSEEAPIKSEVVPSTTEALVNVLAWLH